MALFSFYNVRKPRQFEHKPICWDPDKEELEKRVHRVKREMGLEEESVEEYKDAIRGSFIEGTTHLKKSKSRGDDPRSRHYKNMKLLLALVALAFLFWVMFGR